LEERASLKRAFTRTRSSATTAFRSAPSFDDHMTAIETAVYATHMVFAGLLTGSVLFAALTLPGIAANVSTSVREALAGTLRNVSRASAVLLVLTGGYMLTLGGYTDSGVLTGDWPRARRPRHGRLLVPAHRRHRGGRQSHLIR